MKRFMILALAVAGLLTGCNKESGEMLTDMVAVKFSEVAIRATAATWETGDAIGVYMVAEDATLSDAAVVDGAANKKYTVGAVGASGTFTPVSGSEIYFPISGSAVDFYAYYPYQSAMTNGVYKVDVNDQSNPAAIDLMTATAAGKTKSAPNVALQFTHRLSKLSITASAGDGISANDLVGMTVKIKGLPTTADYNIATGVVTPATTPTDIAARITGTDNLTAEAIVIPQTTIATGGVQVIFSLASGISFDWNLTASALADGSNYVYTIKINRLGVTLTSTNNIYPWTPGNGTDETGTIDEIH